MQKGFPPRFISWGGQFFITKSGNASKTEDISESSRQSFLFCLTAIKDIFFRLRYLLSYQKMFFTIDPGIGLARERVNWLGKRCNFHTVLVHFR